MRTRTHFPKIQFVAFVFASILVVAAAILPVSSAQAATVRQAQWFLDNVHVIEAQKITRGSGVTVCVLDTGVDKTHPDLAGAILPGKSFGQSPSPDATIDADGHGTAMAGLIAARGGGINKALGIAPEAMILPVSPPSSVHSNYAGSIRYCVDHGAKVLNLSGGRPGTISQEDQDAIAYAIKQDVVVVIAMSNRGETTEPNGFALLPGVVAVTGTIQSNEAWPDSWTGPTAALAAPATDVTTFPKSKFSSGYGDSHGTSDSTAIVSGVAALVRAKYPSLNAANVINRLIKSSTDLGAPGRDEIFGFGLVDAEKALTMDVAPVSKNPLGEPETGAKTNPTQSSAANSLGSNRTKASVIGGIIVWAVIISIIVLLIVRHRRKGANGPYPAGSYSMSGVQPPTTINPGATIPSAPTAQPAYGSMPPANVINPQLQAQPPAQPPYPPASYGPGPQPPQPQPPASSPPS